MKLGTLFSCASLSAAQISGGLWPKGQRSVGRNKVEIAPALRIPQLTANAAAELLVQFELPEERREMRIHVFRKCMSGRAVIGHGALETWGSHPFAAQPPSQEVDGGKLSEQRWRDGVSEPSLEISKEEHGLHRIEEIREASVRRGLRATVTTHLVDQPLLNLNRRLRFTPHLNIPRLHRILTWRN